MDFQAEIEHDSADCNAPTLPSQVEEPMDGARYGDGGIPFIPPTQEEVDKTSEGRTEPPSALDVEGDLHLPTKLPDYKIFATGEANTDRLTMNALKKFRAFAEKKWSLKTCITDIALVDRRRASNLYVSL